MKYAIRKDEEGVSPVIAVILMVAITVVLAAVWVSSVEGFGLALDLALAAVAASGSCSAFLAIGRERRLGFDLGSASDSISVSVFSGEADA